MRVVRDRKLGFSAMEETTGWHAAIVAHLMARGRIAVGAAPVELATDSAEIVAELRARDFPIPESVETIEPDAPAEPAETVEPDGADAPVE